MSNIDIKSMFSRPFLSEQKLHKCIFLLCIASTGSILQIIGGSWDVTSHLLLQPETFFTPSHTLLYSGILLLSISALIAAYLLITNKVIRKDPLSLSFKFLIIGSAVSIVSGPSDFIWHEAFGVDGFLSPTHLLLITGMLVNSIGTVMGLILLSSRLKEPVSKNVNRFFLVVGLIALWVNLITYVYIFSLPISNGELFNFNLSPLLESLLALVFLPLVNSFIILLTISTFKKFGYISSVGIGVIILNSVSTILPSQELSLFLPYYLLSAVPFIIIDLMIHGKLPFMRKTSTVKFRSILAGAIAGSLFYIIGYPLLPLALGNYLMPLSLSDMGFTTLVDVLPIFVNSFAIVFPLSLAIGAIVGLISVLMYGQIQVYAKNRLRTRFGLYDKHSSV